MRRTAILALSLAALAVVAACGRDASPTVTPSPVAAQNLTAVSLTISGKTTFTATGQASQLAANVTFSDGSVRDVAGSSGWQTEDADIVRVSATGLVTAAAYGTARVGAFYHAMWASAFVIVRVTDVRPQIPVDVHALTGAWRNFHPAGGVTRIEFRVDQDRVVVHAWGSCLPTDCDWGEISTPVSDAADGVLSLTWNTGFSVMSQQFRVLVDGRLESSVHDHFTDSSGRADYDLVEYLSK
jgi:hypothetical protein